MPPTPIMNSNHVFSAFSFISFVLVSVPFAWHLEHTATSIYMFWVSASNLAFFVNSVVWDGNLADWSPIWCDISGHLIFATNIGIPATCLCIQRRLYRVTVNPLVVITRAEKRRMVIADIMICLGLPMLNLPFSTLLSHLEFGNFVTSFAAYVAQAKRYEILEDFGCHIPTNDTALGVAMIPAWRLIISSISSVYGGINLYHLWNKRRALMSILDSSTGNLDRYLDFNLYLRLLMLSGIDLIITLPLHIWSFTTWFPLMQWPGWTALHADFSYVNKVPASSWRGDPGVHLTIEMTRWVSVIYAFVFFIFFGFAAKARRHYIFALQSVSNIFGFKTVFSSSLNSTLRVPEHYNLQQMNTTRSRDSVLVILSENQASGDDESKSIRSHDGGDGSIAASSTNFSPDSKHEPTEAELTPSSDPKTVLPIKPLPLIQRIPLVSMS